MSSAVRKPSMRNRPVMVECASRAQHDADTTAIAKVTVRDASDQSISKLERVGERHDVGDGLRAAGIGAEVNHFEGVRDSRRSRHGR